MTEVRADFLIRNPKVHPRNDAFGAIGDTHDMSAASVNEPSGPYARRRGHERQRGVHDFERGR
jgi:hypothetical protein